MTGKFTECLQPVERARALGGVTQQRQAADVPSEGIAGEPIPELHLQLEGCGHDGRWYLGTVQLPFGRLDGIKHLSGGGGPGLEKSCCWLPRECSPFSLSVALAILASHLMLSISTHVLGVGEERRPPKLPGKDGGRCKRMGWIPATSKPPPK